MRCTGLTTAQCTPPHWRGYCVPQLALPGAAPDYCVGLMPLASMAGKVAVRSTRAGHLGIMAVQERVLVRRVGRFQRLRHRLAEVFFTQFIP